MPTKNRPARKRIKFYGGRRTVTAKIKRKAFLSGGIEGQVYKVEVVLKSRKGRKKSVFLAEKVFSPEFSALRDYKFNYGMPERQFNTLKDLMRLNKEKKLGLRLPTTVRLRRVNGQPPRLLVTLFESLKEETPTQKKEYYEDLYKQQRIANENGYILQIDSFLPVIDRTGKTVAVIADFGNIEKMHKQNN